MDKLDLGVIFIIMIFKYFFIFLVFLTGRDTFQRLISCFQLNYLTNRKVCIVLKHTLIENKLFYLSHVN